MKLQEKLDTLFSHLKLFFMKSFFISTQLKLCCTNKTGWLRSAKTRIQQGLAVFLLLFFVFNGMAQVPQIDGNPSEWPAILNNAANTKKAFRHDPFNINHIDDSWTGGSQDGDASPSADWTWVYGNSNDKGDIGNAGAVLIGTKLYFFGDRSSFSGDAQIGFWFFLNNVQPTGNGANPGSPFSGEHANGDLLIISNFTNGGGNAVPTVYEWQGKTANSPGAPVIAPNASAALTTNSSQQNVPGGVSGTTMFNGEQWIFAPKFGSAGTYPSPLFFEGWVDLATIEDASLCFQRFLLETRNSQSIGASLQDLVAGAFSGIPQPPTVTPDEICYNTRNIVLRASCSHTSGTPTWYTQATGGTALGTTDGVSADGTTLTLSGLTQSATYYVSCKDGDCESTRTAVTATINPVPTVNGLVSEGENDNAVDDGITKNSDDNYTMRISKTLTASLTASAASGTAPYTYTWEELDADAYTSLSPLTGTSTGNATFTIAAPPSANLRDAYRFRVTVVDDKGCTSTDELIINIDASAPVCVINGPAPVCAGSQNNLYTTNTPLNPDFTYTWSISSTNGSTLDGGSPQAGQISQVSVDAGATAGSYTLTLSIVSATGMVAVNSPCTKTVQVILVAPTSSKTDVVCNGESNGTMTAVGAGGTAPYSYSISPAGNPANTTGAVSGIFTGLAAGIYTVTATDANGCSGTTSQTIGQPDALTCSLTTPTTLTCGSSGTVSGTISGGTAGYSCSAAFDAAGIAGGWSITGCSVVGSTISVSYTSGLSATSAVLTVTVTDANGCTSTCSTTVLCTGGQACSPGFWRNQTQYWDQQSDVAVNNMPGTLTNPVTPGGTFITTTNFWAYFNIPVNQCGLSTNANLTMAEAMINTNLNNVDCKSLVFHGIANLLSASLLPNTYPFPSGSGGNFSGLYTQIRNAFLACDCGGLGSTLGAISALHTGTYCQDAANALNSIVSQDRRAPAVDDGGLIVSAYPNPYSNIVNFRFASPATGKAMLDVYDIVGRRLATVYQGEVKANVPINVKYNVPTLSRVALFYKLTVNNKSVRGSVLPEK